METNFIEFALNLLGVETTDKDNYFKSLDFKQVVSNLGDKWPNLTKFEKALITDIMVGLVVFSEKQ